MPLFQFRNFARSACRICIVICQTRISVCRFCEKGAAVRLVFDIIFRFTLFVDFIYEFAMPVVSDYRHSGPKFQTSDSEQQFMCF